ncbi:MAG: hypothetical protein RIR70_866 [Pseudomonadota bacterium]|jgi:hypothetical protein
MNKLQALFAVMLLLASHAMAGASRYEFALIGDAPYNAIARGQFIDMLKKMGEQPFAFIIHDGDFKDGASACSDAVFADRLALFNGSAHPFVFVPGDNEWTDCHRFTAGSYHPEERLARLREMFFLKPFTLGKKRFELESQSQAGPPHAAYREHLRWQRGPVLFVTLNVPGSRNNIGQRDHPSSEYLSRHAAVIDWMTSSFEIAARRGMKGIVLVMQADPHFEDYRAGKTVVGYNDFLNHLTHEVTRFSGQVMLVHGDTHTLTIDQPLRHPKTGAVIETFTRIQTYGHPYAGWVRVVVDESGKQLFKITAEPWQGE